MSSTTMKQYYVKASVVDNTLGVVNDPTPIEYNTLCLVDTPTGPTDVRYVSGFNEFASLYLNSSGVNVGDNTTIKHVAKLLQVTPLYIKRVVKQEMLEGVSCLGEPLLFDTKHKIKDKYYSLEIDEWSDPYKYYWIGLDGILYYSGTLPYADLSLVLLQALVDGGSLSEDEQKTAEEMLALRQLYPQLKQVYEQKSMSNLLTNLYKYIPYESTNPIFSISKNSISTKNEIQFSQNIVGESREVLQDQNIVITSKSGQYVPEGSFIKVGKNNYYLSTSGTFTNERYSNPVPISLPISSNSADASLFLVKALPVIEANATTMVPAPKVYMDGGLRVGDGSPLLIAQYGNQYDAGDVVFDSVTGKYFQSTENTNDWLDQPIPTALKGNSFSNGQVVKVIEGLNDNYYKCIAPNGATWEGRVEAGVWEDYIFNGNNWLQVFEPNDTAGYWSLSDGIINDVMEVDIDTNTLLRIKNNDKSVIDACVSLRLVLPDGSAIVKQYCIGLGAIYDINKDFEIISTTPMKPLEILAVILEDCMKLGLNVTIIGDVHAYFKRNVTLGIGSSEVGFDFANKIDVVKDGPTETFVYSIPSDETMVSNFAIENFYIKIADNIFYQGENPPAIPTTSATVFVKVGEGEVTYPVFIENFYNALKNYYSTNIYQEKFAFFEDLGDVVEIKAYPGKSVLSNLNLLYMPVVQKTQAKFAVVQKFISSSDSFIWSFENVDRTDFKEELILSLVYRTSEEDYNISFDETVIDGNGISLYYTNVDNDFFEIVKLEGEVMPADNTLSAVEFGSSVKYSVPDVYDFVAAVESIPNEEISAKFSNIWDCGYAHPTYAKAIIKVIKSGIHAMYPLSIPIDYDEEDEIGAYMSAMGSDVDYRHVRTVFGPHYDGTLGEFAAKLNGSYKVLENYVWLYKNVASEFAGQMGKTYARMTGSFAKIFDRTTAGRLLDQYRVACIVGNADDGYFINDNTTGQFEKSDLREEQNVRVLNAINNFLEKYMLQYVGEQNTALLRDKVQNDVKKELVNLVMTNKTVKPTSLSVTCNDSNNTPTDVMKNMLNVRVDIKLINVVKYVETITYAQPLTSTI